MGRTLEELAKVAPWPEARLVGLPGQIRGDVLRGWGGQVEAFFGAGAAARVRARLGLSEAELPDIPSKKRWYPAHLQSRLLRGIADELSGGDLMALFDVFEDANKFADRALALAGKMTGPGAILRLSGRYHRSVCDVGACRPEVTSGAATLVFEGAEIFDEPTWQFANVMGMKSIFKTLGRPLLNLRGAATGPGVFKIEMAW